MVDTVTSAAKAAAGKALPKSSKAQNSISNCLRHRDFVLVMKPPFHFAQGLLFRRGVTSFRCWIALADGGHAAGRVGALGLAAIPVVAVGPVIAASPALREWAVHAAVIMVAAGPVLHKTLKRPMTAIGKLHGIPPSVQDLGFAVYIQNALRRVISFTVKRIFAFDY